MLRTYIPLERVPTHKDLQFEKQSSYWVTSEQGLTITNTHFHPKAAFELCVSSEHSPPLIWAVLFLLLGLGALSLLTHHVHFCIKQAAGSGMPDSCPSKGMVLKHVKNNKQKR